MPRNYYVSGGWNVICDSCGKKIKASEAKQRWDGLIVCPADFEMRQPQDFVKARQDKITVPFTRPRPTDAFILVQGVNDPITLEDNLLAQSSYVRNFTDLITISDAISSDYLKAFADYILADDGSDQYIDPTYFLEDYVQSNPLGGVSIFFGRPLNETLNLVDAFTKQYSLSENEATTLLEYVMGAYQKQTSELIGLSDNIQTQSNYPRNFTDTIVISDSLETTKSFVRILTDNSVVNDLVSIFKNTVSTPSDTVNMSDLISRVVTYRRTITDLTTTTDLPSIKPNKRVSDTTTVVDSGNLFYNGYIDPTYFASDYVGTRITF